MNVILINIFSPAHCSPLSSLHSSLIARCFFCCSLFSAHRSLPFTHHSLLVAFFCCFLFSAHRSLPFTHCSLLIAHCSLLVAFFCCSLFSAHRSLPFTHRSSLIAHCSSLKIRNVSSYIILRGPIATISMCCFSG